MSKKIHLSNFLAMHPESPQFSDKNQHYLISGSNPTYYLDSTGTQEEQVAPLIASNVWTIASPVFDGNVVDATESTEGTYEAYAIDDTSKVYGFTTASSPVASYPTGSSSAVGGGAVKCFNSKLLCAPYKTIHALYYATLPALSSWSSTGTLTGNSVPTILELFLEYCMINDADSKIKKIDSSLTILTGIDLGSGWTVNGMRNFNDKYLAIAGSLGSFNNNYLFLWNGRADTYQYSVKMAGKFQDMKVIDGILYVAVWIGGTGNTVGTGKTVLYYLVGTTLREVLIPQISTIKSGFKVALFDFIKRVGINLYSTDLMIYGKSEVGTEQFVLSTGTSFTLFTETYKGNLYGFASKNLYSYTPTSSTWNTISYKSQWIPVKNISGIDIEYDTPPQSGTDAINVTIYGRGEDIIAGNSTTVLDSITPTTYLNTTRTRLDVKGFVGDKIKIQLSSVNEGSWRCSIRKISIITE